MPDDKEELRPWTDVEEEDYQYYLNNLNKVILKEKDFDALGILEGNIPELTDDLQKTKCAVAVGTFIKRADINFLHHEDYTKSLGQLAERLDTCHLVIMMKQLTISQMEFVIQAARKTNYNKFLEQMDNLTKDLV